MSHIGKKYRFLKKYVCILVGLWLRSKPNLAFSKNLSLDPLVALPMEKIPMLRAWYKEDKLTMNSLKSGYNT